jgi:Na+-driven multidrug efflux pump
VLFLFRGEWLTSFFLGAGAHQTQALAVPLLQIVAISQPSLALSMVLSGALRGAGDTRWPLTFTFIGFVGLRIPLAYLLAWDEVSLPLLGVTLQGYGLGVIGAWYAMVTDVIVRSLLILTRFLHGGWKRIRV